jgi:quinol-cytochrome oxidoreductase complex cytochrome b subunit
MNRYRRFYPDYLSEVIVTIAVCVEAVLIASLLFPPAVGRQIDLTRQFQPRPEWYFLWLFEIIGYFPGKSAFVGTVVLPMVFVILFLAIPYIDRGPKGAVRATSVGIGLLLTFAVFTLLSALK